jgi:hypothetical protein
MQNEIGHAATKNEIGRELQLNELHRASIVVLHKNGQPFGVTMWVAIVGMDFVAFYSGALNVTWIGHLREDGTLSDEKGERIRVFEYIGEP